MKRNRNLDVRVSDRKDHLLWPYSMGKWWLGAVDIEVELFGTNLFQSLGVGYLWYMICTILCEWNGRSLGYNQMQSQEHHLLLAGWWFQPRKRWIKKSLNSIKSWFRLGVNGWMGEGITTATRISHLQRSRDRSQASAACMRLLLGQKMMVI